MTNINPKKSKNIYILTFWSIIIIGFCFFIYLLGKVLIPFFFALILSYLLNPMVSKLETKSLSRNFSAIILILTFMLIMLGFIIIIMPSIIYQLAIIIQKIPYIIEKTIAIARNHDIHNFTDLRNTTIGSTIIDQLITIAPNISIQIMGYIKSSTWALVNFFSILIITPIATYYILVDWKSLINTIKDLIPKSQLSKTSKIALQIDENIFSFLKGQGLTCLFLASYYAIGLTFIGLQSGLLIGIIIGTISFIPFVGSILGGLLCLIVAVGQFWPDQWVYIIVVGSIFIVGNIIEGYVLQPKLIGNRVGLHPAWVMFALVAFTYLFGFIGALLAIPLAAIIRVLAITTKEYYKSTDTYNSK